MKVGYVVLYEDDKLVISKDYIILPKKIKIDYGEFEDTLVQWKNNSNEIKKVQILDQVKSNCTSEWFDGCINLTTLIDFKNLDVSDYADFSYMFRNCESLQDLKGLQNCRNMFSFCKSLQDLKGLQN